MTAERVILQTIEREPNLYQAAGELGEWQCNVAMLCIGNSRLIFAVCCAFAGPLLGLVGEDGGGFNLLGASRVGKSTALRLAASVWGGGSPGGAGAFIRQWRATANALEAVAAQHSDTLLPLDEMGQVDARDAGEVAYMLAAGQGKVRASRGGLSRPVIRFRVLFLSTGEIGLADKNDEAGRATKAGQEVRVANVPTDAGKGCGTFENVHGAADAAAFADELRDMTTRYYGTAAPAFLRALVALLGRAPDAPSAIRDRAKALRTAWLDTLPEAGGQVTSVAFRFALVAIAGELATEFKVTGWPAGTASAGVERCFRAWLAERGTMGAREDEQAVTQLRDFILTHGSSRFEPWHEPDDAHQVAAMPPERFRSVNRAGWRRATPDGQGGPPSWTYYVTSAAMHEALKSLNFQDAIKLLVARGYLTRDAAGKASRSIAVPGHQQVRLYVICGAILGFDGLSAG